MMVAPGVAGLLDGGYKASRYRRRVEREQITLSVSLDIPRSVPQRIGPDSPKSAALSTELRARRAKSRRHMLRTPKSVRCCKEPRTQTEALVSA